MSAAPRETPMRHALANLLWKAHQPDGDFSFRNDPRQGALWATRLAEWLMERGVTVPGAPAPEAAPLGPDGVCGPTGGNPTPLSDLAAMAVDLGDPTLSATFKKRGASSTGSSLAARIDALTPDQLHDFMSKVSLVGEGFGSGAGDYAQVRAALRAVLGVP